MRSGLTSSLGVFDPRTSRRPGVALAMHPFDEQYRSAAALASQDQCHRRLSAAAHVLARRLRCPLHAERATLDCMMRGNTGRSFRGVSKFEKAPRHLAAASSCHALPMICASTSRTAFK